MSRTFAIRPLAAADRPQWDALWRGYLDFYETSVPAAVSDVTFARLLDPAEPMFCRVAEAGAELIGLVHFIYHRSTWTPGPYCYLQDLFAVPSAREKGVGRALIETVYDEARAHGASRVHWLTHETNATARLLYDRIAERSGHIQYRKILL